MSHLYTGVMFLFPLTKLLRSSVCPSVRTQLKKRGRLWGSEGIWTVYYILSHTSHSRHVLPLFYLLSGNGVLLYRVSRFFGVTVVKESQLKLDKLIATALVAGWKQGRRRWHQIPSIFNLGEKKTKLKLMSSDRRLGIPELRLHRGQSQLNPLNYENMLYTSKHAMLVIGPVMRWYGRMLRVDGHDGCNLFTSSTRWCTEEKKGGIITLSLI